MKVVHECSRNIPAYDMEVYTYDKTRDKTWYIKAHIIFYCPYCGIDVNKIDTVKPINKLSDDDMKASQQFINEGLERD